MDKTHKALSWLERDKLWHIDMIEPIKRGDAEIAYAEDDGVAIYVAKGGICMLSFKSREQASRLIAEGLTAPVVAVHQHMLVKVFTQAYGYRLIGKCVQAAYLKTQKLPVPDTIQIRQLDDSFLDMVALNYKNGDRAYVQNRIEAGVMYGAFIEGTLTGFVGMHEEGSIGLLEVFPEFRRCGIGEALDRDSINRMLEKGYTPYCQVFTDNKISLHLQEKLGYTFSDKHVWWLESDAT